MTEEGSQFKIKSIPNPFSSHNAPQIKTDGESTIEIVAGSKTDLFFDPANNSRLDTAPCALFTPPDQDFTLSVRVQVDFAASFDAGLIQLRTDDEHWAKFCFEYSPHAKPTIVSVVTRGVSDDCNSVVIPKSEVYLRVARKGNVLALHYSEDASYWHLVRYFTLPDLQQLRVGLSSQSPMGPGCRAVFSEIKYTPRTILDFRNGE